MSTEKILNYLHRRQGARAVRQDVRRLLDRQHNHSSHPRHHGATQMKQKRIILIGYKIGSRSLKNLQTQLKEDQTERRVLRVRRTSIRYKRRVSDRIVAWGPTLPSPHVDQQQEAAKKIASNKLLSFRKFKEHNVPTPEWTTDLNIAMSWVNDDNKTVFARTLLCSHSGKGIYVMSPTSNMNAIDAKLYVQYKKKKHEYRVHVFNNTVIDITQKKRRVGHENRNNQIRNHANGWVYARENLEIPDNIQEIALNACDALGLHSGAVDIIWNEKENKCYVLEINSAPGIEGTTLKNYANAILDSFS
jgi:hypothetical protein